MSFAKVYSAQTSLLKAHIIDVEIDILKGLHSFSIVGLPDKAVEESRDRVSAAIKNSGFPSPKKKNQKIVVSLAPADLKKEGNIFDLAIALAYLRAYKDSDTKSPGIEFDPEGKIFLGELSLDGKLRPVKGVLALVIEAKKKGFTEVFVPIENAKEAALIEEMDIYGANTLREVVDHLNKDTKAQLFSQEKTEVEYTRPEYSVSFSDVKGNESAKRGLEIAAAGGHNIAMYGPPGTGKTMLARAFSGILPVLSFDHVLEVTGIHSVAGRLGNTLVTQPPFRSPHHTASYVSMVGGGTYPKPGEVTLAHRGVLFLDEFPEFDRRVVEALRQPLEDSIVSITRAKGSATFPANFILVASMNPCPCGHRGSSKECICTPIQVERYKRKLSGPIIDRVDMWIEVSKVDHEKLSDTNRDETEELNMKDRIGKARTKQAKRFKKHPHIQTNSDMGAKELLELVQLNKEVKYVLNDSAKLHDMSARAYHRIIKLARTIADLGGDEDISQDHVLEAIQYRFKEKV